ncbi:hypothetical protein F5884DRAFT_837578 [Xylogone sp. PMI_703]|nr:hypothetical protein F5884DRAFT_837578 [Xylogone sp. PMI_703]
MSKTEYDRNTLVTRILPEMQLYDNSSKSSIVLSQRHTSSPEKSRFTVAGNAIITGGTGTLALEGVRALLEHGLSGVALFDINPGAASSAIDSLRADFPKAKILAKKVDVTDADNINLSVEGAFEELGSIDILCCFAGVVGCVHAVDMSPAEWRRTLEINTTGSFLCAQAAAKKMIIKNSGGSIVFISSISGHIVNYPQPQIAYNTSKSALLHMKNCLAAEWARYGIRTNSISPGYMDTVLNEGPGLDRARRIWNERNPMGRMGLAQELTGPLVLLCSNAGSFMNGTDIVVDGGATVF